MRALLHSAMFIRSVHTLIFFVMGGLLLGFLLEVILDTITPLTWIAVVVLLLEGVVLIFNGWRCPLGTYAEHIGAITTTESDMLFPRWFTALIFPVCSTLLAVALVLLVVRVLN
jgi:hypothetical protein